MPALNLPNLNFNIDSGTNKQTLEQIVDSLSKYRKELNFLLMNLDIQNMPSVGDTIEGITATADAITSVVSGNSGRISIVEQTANGLVTTVQNNVDDISQVTQTANGLVTTVQNQAGEISQVTQTANGLVSAVQNNVDDISQVEQTATSITTYIGAMTGITDSYAQQIITAGGITSMVGKHIDSILAQDSAISTVEQTADSLALTVTSHTTAIEEQEIFKQSSAPAHKTNRLWLNTGVSPNVMYRSTGYSWIKASPTNASDIGLNMATYATTSSLTQTSDAINLRFTNLKALNGVETISGGVTNITQSGIKITHSGTNQYSEMRADGFIRQWAYGQAKYLNDIWVSTITTTDGNSYTTEPPATRIYLPQSFRGRQLTTEVFLTVSGLNNTQLGSKYDITSTGVRLAWYGTWLDIEINIVGQNWDVASPYIDIKAFTYVNGPVIPSYSNPTGGNFTENYRKISFTVMLVGR